MNDEIYKKIITQQELLELFSKEELDDIFVVLGSELSDTKKKEEIETIITRLHNENI